MINLFSVNSVGSECHPYKLEVLGSNPRPRTTQRDYSTRENSIKRSLVVLMVQVLRQKWDTLRCSYFHIEDDESKLMYLMDVCFYDKKFLVSLKKLVPALTISWLLAYRV